MQRYLAFGKSSNSSSQSGNSSALRTFAGDEAGYDPSYYHKIVYTDEDSMHSIILPHGSPHEQQLILGKLK